MRSRTSQERGRWRGSDELQSDHTCQLRAHEKSHVTGERQVERERELQSDHTCQERYTIFSFTPVN